MGLQHWMAESGSSEFFLAEEGHSTSKIRISSTKPCNQWRRVLSIFLSPPAPFLSCHMLEPWFMNQHLQTYTKFQSGHPISRRNTTMAIE